MSYLATLWVLATSFAGMSVVAIGGANTMVPEMQRLAVDTMHWMTSREFTELFALTQAAPGPNVMICVLVGWRAAGLTGAAVAMTAMVLPSSLMTYGVTRAWDRFRDKPWRKRVQNGLAPATAGLVTASAYLLARAADVDVRTTALTAIVAVIAYRSKMNPLWLLGAGAVAGAVLYW